MPGPSSRPGQQGREGRVPREGTGGSTQGHWWGWGSLLIGFHPASLLLPTSHFSDDYDDTDDDDPFNPQVPWSEGRRTGAWDPGPKGKGNEYYIPGSEKKRNGTRPLGLRER